jgi:hypothetical protein
LDLKALYHDWYRAPRYYRLLLMGFRFSKLGRWAVIHFWPTEWEEYYLPKKLGEHDLILDVGALEGDSAVFYFFHGYDNLRLVEPCADYWPILDHNAQKLRDMGAKVKVLHRRFMQEDLNGAAFVKFDCEGCEYEMDFSKLTIPWVAEMHVQKPPLEGGRYDWSDAIGYRTGNQ